MTRRLLGLLGGCALLLSLGGAASAAATKGPTLEVSVILATQSDAGGAIDPQLRDLPQLTRDQPFVRYNVYHLIDRRVFPLDPKKPASMNLANGRTLQVTLENVTEDKNEKRYQMASQISEPGKKAFLKSLEVTASANDPFFVGGQNFQGGTLFLELLVHP